MSDSTPTSAPMPKPWELPTTPAPSAANDSKPTASAAPAPPPRPYANTTSRYPTTNQYSPYSTTGYSPYASTGYSPYSQQSSYMNYHQPYSMYNRQPYYGGNSGPPGGGLQSSTQAAFDILFSFVQSFSSFASMLDSTLNTTFQSFHAMMAVADQMTHVKNTVGQLFSLYALLARLRSAFRVLTLRGSQADQFDVGEFNKDLPNVQVSKVHKKPILIFLALVFGLPYLLTKLINFLSKRLADNHQDPGKSAAAIDPNNIEFARAVYSYAASNPNELSFNKGDILAIINKPLDPSTGLVGNWWQAKLEQGPVGYIPNNYVEILSKPSS